MIASVEARSGSWILPWARFSSSFFLEGARLDCFGRGPLRKLDVVDSFRQNLFLEGPRLDDEPQWGPLRLLEPASVFRCCRGPRLATVSF